MKLLIDMNLSPSWIPLLVSQGWETIHWSNIGAVDAPDTDLLSWARENGYVVLTQDMDFSQLLFAAQASGPSVVLLRMDNEFDSTSRQHVCRAIATAEDSLNAGALLTIKGSRVRLRHLPIET